MGIQAPQRGTPPPGFRDPLTGIPVAYAARASARLVADAFYLDRLHRVGHAQAAAETCERHGHDARGGLCDRCGSPTR